MIEIRVGLLIQKMIRKHPDKHDEMALQLFL